MRFAGSTKLSQEIGGVGHPDFCCRYGRTIASRLVEMTILFEGETADPSTASRSRRDRSASRRLTRRVQLIFVFGFAARKREQRKGLRPVSFNPCSAPVTPAQTWGTRPGGTERFRILGFNLEKGTAGWLTIQTVAPTAR
jgi:hypothetical protein